VRTGDESAPEIQTSTSNTQDRSVKEEITNAEKVAKKQAALKEKMQKLQGPPFVQKQFEQLKDSVQNMKKIGDLQEEQIKKENSESSSTEFSEKKETNKPKIPTPASMMGGFIPKAPDFGKHKPKIHKPKEEL